MDQPLFDVYLTGRLATGLTAADAAQRFAQLFRMPPETAAGLINGKPQPIKRGVDEATAQKFRDALQRAGLEVALRPQTQAAEPHPATTAATGGLSLAPSGTDLLKPEERRHEVTATVDISHLSLASQHGGRAVFGEKPPAPAEPSGLNTDHIRAPDFGLAPAEGELLRPEEKSAPPAVIPTAPALTVAEPGALLETLPNDVAAVAPDISGLSLAPQEGDLLRPDEHPAKPAPVVPDISHLQLRN